MLLFLFNCGQTEEVALTNSKFFFINDLEYRVEIVGDCGFGNGKGYDSYEVIEPNDTLIVTQVLEVNVPPDPSISNITVLFPGACFAVYDSLKCDAKPSESFRNLDNYEKKIEVSNNQFEFTYRFTQDDYDMAKDCPKKW